MRLKLAIGVPLVGALISLAMIAWGQHQALSVTREQLAAERATVKGQANVIKIMEANAQLNAQDSAELTRTLQKVQELAGESRQAWELIKRENKEFKEWAESILPDHVSRLRSRPAIIGAKEYQSWLQQSHRLHPTGQSASAK